MQLLKGGCGGRGGMGLHPCRLAHLLLMPAANGSAKLCGRAGQPDFTPGLAADPQLTVRRQAPTVL